MPLRINAFRSILLFPYSGRTSSSSSLSTMSHVNMNKGDDIADDNVRTPPTRRRIDVNVVLKHLGVQQRPNASVTASNNTGCSLSVTTKNQSSVMHLSMQDESCASDKSVNCSKLPESCARDVKHEDNRSSPVSLVASSGGSGEREGSLEENDFVPDIECTRMLEESSLPTSFGKREPSQSKKSKSSKHNLKIESHIRCKHPMKKSYAPVEVFDICRSKAEDFVQPESSLEFLDEAEETVDKLSKELEPSEIVLRPGMVLLKNYISLNEQVSIVKKCRELGIGPGGFYRPGYKDGAKLRLHMMCLGLDWDPQSRRYGKTRRIDKCKPPRIPPEFCSLVDKAMLDSLALIKRDSNISNPENILPRMYPDICIVNFYSEAGRLGLHQDRDESKISLTGGLPVVSLSLGDSAEFLYGDDRKVDNAEHLVLESGDVLIFGGQSRHIFHGISSIIPNSAPRSLIEETRLLSGRLNLTFRQY